MNNQIINQIKLEEKQAINYIENELIPNHNDFQIQGFWQAAILNFLKEQALIFIGKSLEHLKIKAIPWMIDLAAYLLINLEDYLVVLYNRSKQEEKELFLSKIEDSFPQSNLLKRIK